MIKAGALYFAIVAAFFIAIISASLLMLAANYRTNYLKEIRFTRLANNVQAGINIALMDQYKNDTVIAVDLYADQVDSVIIKKKRWGIFEMALVTAFIAQDTLKKALIIGKEADSVVIYLTDENRPLALSGTTTISGNVNLPKSGARKAYTEGKSYKHAQLIFNGKIASSTRSLPKLDTAIIRFLYNQAQTGNYQPLLDEKYVINSFVDSTLSYQLPAKGVLKNNTFKGNIIFYADSSITVSASSQLAGVQLYAPYIKIEEGFEGSCQLFATDSITIGKKSKLRYPSVAAVLGTKKPDRYSKITVAQDAVFEGIIFTYEQKRSTLQTLISIQRNALVKGEVYAGLVKLDSGVTIHGKTSCNLFLMQTSTLLYENFLIDVNLNRIARSKYYLSSPLFTTRRQNKVLKWLN
jgi:cytoskeletal protein CcmA (bactofilin family)